MKTHGLNKKGDSEIPRGADLAGMDRKFSDDAPGNVLTFRKTDEAEEELGSLRSCFRAVDGMLMGMDDGTLPRSAINDLDAAIDLLKDGGKHLDQLRRIIDEGRRTVIPTSIGGRDNTLLEVYDQAGTDLDQARALMRVAYFSMDSDDDVEKGTMRNVLSMALERIDALEPALKELYNRQGDVAK